MRAIAVLIVALVAVSAAQAASITRSATTESYKLSLAVGPNETMYTQAQAKSMHLKSGEVMIGSTSMAPSMAMKGQNLRHLELQVRSRATGAVVTNVTPQMTLTDTSGTGMSMSGTKVDAMAMQGIGKGLADRHYGNNVSLKLGDSYKLNVVVHGEKASFTFKAS